MTCPRRGYVNYQKKKGIACNSSGLGGLTYDQTVGSHGLMKGNDNHTQFSDCVLVATTALGSFQEALLPGKGLESLMEISSKRWEYASRYKGSSNGNKPHEKATYLQASVVMLIQCPTPSCTARGSTEQICFECGLLPFVKTPKVPTTAFQEFCAKHPGLGTKEVEEKFKKDQPTRPPYQVKKPETTRTKYQDYMDTHQGELQPQSKWK